MTAYLTRLLGAGALCACLFLLGCGGGKAYQYEPANELKPGPGILSGEDGEFTLIERSRGPQKPTAAGPPEQEEKE